MDLDGPRASGTRGTHESAVFFSDASTRQTSLRQTPIRNPSDHGSTLFLPRSRSRFRDLGLELRRCGETAKTLELEPRCERSP